MDKYQQVETNTWSEINSLESKGPGLSLEKGKRH